MTRTSKIVIVPTLALLAWLSFTGHFWLAFAVLFIVSWMGW